MKITTKGRYALRVMVDLAINSKGEYISLKDIAERQEISNKYLEQIIAMGNNGGYQLAKKPSEYKVGDILRATEVELAPTYCLTEEGECKKKENCKTFSFWKGLDEAISQYVDSKTLEDLAK